MAAERRIAALSRHLTSSGSGDALPAFDPKEVYAFLTNDNLPLRARILDFLKDDIYKPDHYLSLFDFRELTLQRLRRFTDQRFFSTADYIRDPLRFQAGLETLALCDYSLCIKAGVHFTLCGGAIAKLGTAKHHTELFPRLDSLDLPGCFGMTELGHGSNVMGIETQAVYEPQSHEFVIHTPTDTASKFWIGGAAQHGKVCTVFAQLTVAGKWEGPHVFVVRLRDDAGQLMPGVRIMDNGPKAGLNGVDNGQIWFDHVRVPRDALLNRFADVSAEGVYSSSIPSLTTRFGVVVGGLTVGRMLIGQGAIDAAKIGVTIALRYACQRPQFGNKTIMTYLTHQRRLLPALATTYALHLAMQNLKALHVSQKSAADGKAIHVISSGLKAASTWARVETLQACRECCGGQGFLAANRIGPLKNDMDVDVTFEGDNTVMMQQVAKDLLDAAMKSPQRPAQPAVSKGSLDDLATLQSLLVFREQALTAEVASEMASAAKAAAPQGKASATAAASAAYEAHLDHAVSLGWAFVERLAFEGFVRELQRAPEAARPALEALARLYGLTRLEKHMAVFLAHGALQGQHAAAIRLAVNHVCAALSAHNGRAALLLCEGFGIPDHLILAPIAFDWKAIGSSAADNR